MWVKDTLEKKIRESRKRKCDEHIHVSTQSNGDSLK